MGLDPLHLGQLEASLSWVLKRKEAQEQTMIGANGTNGVFKESGGITAMIPPPTITTDPAAHQDNKPVPADLKARLYEPLPAEAVKPHPTKDYLSTIKTIYAIDRLNQVFGIGGWGYSTEIIDALPVTVERERNGNTTTTEEFMVVMKVRLKIPAYHVDLEQYGGHQNADRGDAYKGAVTDALSKLCGYIGVGMDVYKGNGPTRQEPNRGRQPRAVAMPPKPRPAAELQTAAGIDTGGHPVGTKEAAEHVAQQKIAAGTAAAAEPKKVEAPALTRGAVNRMFQTVREVVGDHTYLEHLAKFGLNADLKFRTSAQAMEIYNGLLALMTTKQEVA
jgi:hypothetical protein